MGCHLFGNWSEIVEVGATCPGKDSKGDLIRHQDISTPGGNRLIYDPVLSHCAQLAS